MKNIFMTISAALVIYLTSCSKSPEEKVQSNVATYLKENLKNPVTYESVSFSKIDTLKKADTTENNKISYYRVNHVYNVTNSENVKVKMQVTFYLDQNLFVNETKSKSINGDFGVVTGNAYWKYNNYVGNKADAGTEVSLFSLDTARGDLSFKATADVQGNYKIEKVPPGKYLLLVRSNNATDCPDAHLHNIIMYSSYFKQLFGFDIESYVDQIAEIDRIDSLAGVALTTQYSGYNSASKSLDAYYKFKEQSREKTEKLFELFPNEFKRKIKLYTGYSNASEMKVIFIEDGETENTVTDFDITCI